MVKFKSTVVAIVPRAFSGSALCGITNSMFVLNSRQRPAKFLVNPTIHFPDKTYIWELCITKQDADVLDLDIFVDHPEDLFIPRYLETDIDGLIVARDEFSKEHADFIFAKYFDKVALTQWVFSASPENLPYENKRALIEEHVERFVIRTVTQKRNRVYNPFTPRD